MPRGRRALNRRAAGKGQAQQAGDLVERLAGGVVDRAAQQLEVQRPAAVIQARVPAADDQADAGKDVLAGRQAAGVDMGLQVIDGHQRHVPAPGTSALAADSPTSSEPARPGVVATATAES